MLVVTYKVLHDKGLDDLCLCLSLPLLTIPELIGCHDPGPIRQCHLVGPRGHIFPVPVPAPWKSIVTEKQMAPTLFIFHKVLKIWMFSQVFRLRG